MKTINVIEKSIILGKEIKIYGTIEEPLFLAKDIAKYIEHNKPFEMIQNIDDDEKLKATLSLSGQRREYWFITEDGLYEILLQSRKPVAKEFKIEVKKVIKSIRKYGMYATNELINNPDLLIKTAQKIKEQQQQIVNQKKAIIEYQQYEEENKPLVTFAQTVQDTKETILIRQLAKLASNKTDISIGEKQLYNILREWKMIQQHSTEPYISYVKNGIFQLKETVSNGHIVLLTKVTPKGQTYIINRLIEELSEIQYNLWIAQLKQKLKHCIITQDKTGCHFEFKNIYSHRIGKYVFNLEDYKQLIKTDKELSI